MRTWLYIDGYNFYYGLKKGPSRYPIGLGWCDFRRLAEQHFLKSGDRLERIRYFTAPVSKYGVLHGEAGRQAVWLDAAQTIPGLDVVEGEHIHPKNSPRKEKMTDVNIAVELVLDGADPTGYEKAILLSSDLDLIPAAVAAKFRLDPPREIEVRLSPDSDSYLVRERCEWYDIPCSPVTPEMLLDARFPDQIRSGNETITCEPRWRLPKNLSKQPWARKARSSN